jgi:GNAT superfamily N-acetyltransferase
VIDRLLRMAGHGGGEQASVVIRQVNPRRFDDDIRVIFELYNQSFAHLWGFVPIRLDEFMERAREFRQFYRPDLALVAEYNGHAAGFAIGLPDINVALRGLDGRLWPFGILRIMYRVRRIRTMRLVLLGVLPELLGHGIAGRLAWEMASAARRLGMQDSELSLVQAGNRSIRKVIDAFGGVPVKTYRLYAKDLEV